MTRNKNSTVCIASIISIITKLKYRFILLKKECNWNQSFVNANHILYADYCLVKILESWKGK